MEENILDISNQPPMARPIGGWLYVIGGIILLSIITNVSVFIQYLILIIELDKVEFLATDESIYKRIFVISDFTIGLINVIWLIIIFPFFVKKRKKFPFAYLAYLGFFIISKVLSIVFIDYLNKRNIFLEGKNLSGGLLYVGIYSMMVGSYFTKSKRVSQTFVN
ncbi:MAG: DUF2569 domain-containing protein [Flammeovirgaceae bacterium]|nr:DUF2569 domain-containing protein [Flammeovirgaceae bacterium]